LLSIVDAMDDPNLFEAWFRGDSWNGWRAILKGAFALPMTDEERAFFRTVAERDPPARRVRELWIPAGRRSGKDSIASLVTAYSAALFAHDDRLRPGERAVCLCLAVDRDQAKIVLNYTRSFFADIHLLRETVTRETANGFQLEHGVDVVIGTNSFRSVRGRPILCAVLDECAFYRDENSSAPDEEVYRAITPGMATIPEAMLIGISSPYRKSGLLYRKFVAHFGKASDDVLVIRAPSLTLNPTLDPAIIERALEEDPAAARAEWLAEFRDDIGGLVSADAVAACVVSGRHELARVGGVTYVAFVDAAGGSGTDSMTLGIAHSERRGDLDVGVLDLVREIRPPFSPDAATAEFASIMRSYGVSRAIADKYACDWVEERFRSHNVRLDQSAKPKSSIYLELLAPLNSHRVELLDNKRLVAQLCNLERRTGRGTGREVVDHPRGGADDLINAAAGALVGAVGRKQLITFSEQAIRALELGLV